jgi:hypothetical protein
VSRDAVVEWLLDTDPSLRWQVERDLVGAPPRVWQATRSRVATEGDGARLLALQDADGQWAGGAFFPAGTLDDPAASGSDGQPWTATTWTLCTLREWGTDPAALGDTADRLAASCRWEYEDLPYWGGEVDCCINAWTVANGAWLGVDVAPLARWFAEHQLDDGGWNCEWVEGATRSSFHSTLNSLKGLLWYERLTGDAELRAVRHRGQEYLLERRLLHRLGTGEVVGPWVTRLGYPYRWVYSVLNAADHFRAAGLHDQTSPDPRLAEAVELVRGRRQTDGRWLQEHRVPGAVWFEEDVPVGRPSPWLTLHGSRVLDWWDGAAATG